MPRRLTILAGSGHLVTHVIEAALRAGDAVQVIAFTPQPDRAGIDIVPGDASRPEDFIRGIAAFASTHVTLAGAIQLGDRHREALAGFAAGGAATSAGDAVLSRLARTIEELSGATLVGAHEIAADLLARSGHIAGPAIADAALAASRIALDAARAIGRIDLGQAVVVAGRRVVAAEDVGGTDELLVRVAEHRRLGRIGDGSGVLVLAKAAKPQQPLYVDLPAIGPNTVAGAAAAGIVAIALDAGRALVLDRSAVESAAATHGVSIIGLDDA